MKTPIFVSQDCPICYTHPFDGLAEFVQKDYRRRLVTICFVVFAYVSCLKDKDSQYVEERSVFTMFASGDHMYCVLQ